MNRRRLIKILAALSVLYVAIWIGIVVWAFNDTKRNNWLVDKEADPATAPLPNVSKDDWVAILATPNFVSKPLNERIAIANQHFEKIKDVASEQGYDLRALQAWYQETATHLERYPIKTFAFAQNMKTAYRDLQNSEFPKPTFWTVFRSGLFTKGVMFSALVALPFVAILLSLLAGIFIAVFSKSLSIKWRVLVLALVVIILAEAWLIRNEQRHPVSLGFYHFYDAGNYLSVQGTWSSDTKLAAPAQTTKLDCWRQWNQCIEATAQVFEQHLSISTSYWEIKEWLPDEVTFLDNDSSVCKIDSLRVDRKGKIVTATNVPKQPISDFCKSIGDDPIVSHLVDGIKRQFK